jgi:hypothetical protein
MADPLDVFTPYSTASALMGVLPTWMDEYDAQRITAYQIYEQIYWNVPDTYKLVQRGTAASPIYIPNGRTIVDSTDRYTAAGFGYVIDPQFGTTSDQTNLALALKTLFDRERFLSKFHANKRMGLIRGDWAFHIVADPLKDEGKRISIYTVDPGALFRIEAPDDTEKLLGYHIIEQIQDGDKTLIKRQTYTKGEDPYSEDLWDGTIWSSHSLCRQRSLLCPCTTYGTWRSPATHGAQANCVGLSASWRRSTRRSATRNWPLHWKGLACTPPMPARR